jgi:hypothetical protein
VIGYRKMTETFTSRELDQAAEITAAYAGRRRLRLSFFLISDEPGLVLRDRNLPIADDRLPPPGL